MIIIADYGIGNLRSVQKAFETVDAEVVRSGDPDVIGKATKLVLPGVGAFGACMQALTAHGLVEPLLDAVDRGVPLLGVCVGMQMLFDSSDEKGRHRGLGLIEGHVTRFPADMRDAAGRPLKIPHMGWNRLAVRKPTPLLGGIGDEAYVYFVHSYYGVPSDEHVTAASAPYGIDFPAVVARNRVCGVQFHPEKSQQAGLTILRNFVERF
jgi:imidazole glycerol-phosphate synthase subunit HisH